MSIFDPENRESLETYREARELSKKTEASLREALEAGADTVADIVGCPNAQCRCPLKVDVQEELIELSCSNCGFSDVIKKQ